MKLLIPCPRLLDVSTRIGSKAVAEAFFSRNGELVSEVNGGVIAFSVEWGLARSLVAGACKTKPVVLPEPPNVKSIPLHPSSTESFRPPSPPVSLPSQVPGVGTTHGVVAPPGSGSPASFRDRDPEVIALRKDFTFMQKTMDSVLSSIQVLVNRRDKQPDQTSGRIRFRSFFAGEEGVNIGSIPQGLGLVASNFDLGGNDCDLVEDPDDVDPEKWLPVPANWLYLLNKDDDIVGMVEWNCPKI